MDPSFIKCSTPNKYRNISSPLCSLKHSNNMDTGSLISVMLWYSYIINRYTYIYVCIYICVIYIYTYIHTYIYIYIYIYYIMYIYIIYILCILYIYTEWRFPKSLGVPPKSSKRPIWTSGRWSMESTPGSQRSPSPKKIGKTWENKSRILCFIFLGSYLPLF